MPLAGQIYQVLSLLLAFSDIREDSTKIVIETFGVSPAYLVNRINNGICPHDRFPSSNACGVHTAGIE
jgi:hypothetical protein